MTRNKIHQNILRI